MKIVDCGEQRSESWLAYRKTKCMASEVAAIMGKSPWTTVEDIFYEKLGLGKERVVNAAMQQGIDLEDTAREMLNAKLGVEFKPCVVESTEHNWLGCSLDGYYDWQIDPNRHMKMLEGRWICELKCGGEKGHSMTKHGVIPDYYLLQIQQQMLVTGADLCFFANYFDGDIAVVEVRPDHDMQAEIIEATREFWQRVQDLDPPEPKYVEREDQDWLIAVANLSTLQRDIKSLQDREAEAKARLIELSAGKSTKGYGMAVIHSVRAGTVDYSKLCAENKIDAAKYRKPAMQVVTVRKVK
ncbi:MAG: YqaJ viral recombinase family protein [Acetomicrobium sp.]|nr:YqaJ viral recombinase family protein [Acetomicrobium sp.]